MKIKYRKDKLSGGAKIISITLEDCDNGICDIPEYITRGGKTLTVTRLKSGLLCENEDITKVTIPKSISAIPDYFCSACPNMQEIAFGNNIKLIDACAFISSENLKRVYFDGTIADWIRIDFRVRALSFMATIDSFFFRNNLGDFELLEHLIIRKDCTLIDEGCPFMNFNCIKKVTINTGGDLYAGKCSLIASCKNIEHILIENTNILCEELIEGMGTTPLFSQISNMSGLFLEIGKGVTSIPQVLITSSSTLERIKIGPDVVDIASNSFPCSMTIEVEIDDACPLETEEVAKIFSYTNNHISIQEGLRICDETDCQIDEIKMTNVVNIGRTSTIRRGEFRDAGIYRLYDDGDRAYLIRSNPEKYVPGMDISIPDGVNAILSTVLSESKCVSMFNEVCIPKSIKFFISEFSSIINFYIPLRYQGTIEDWCRIKFLEDESNPLTFANKFIVDDEELHEINVPITIDKVNDFAFRGISNSGIVKINIPESVTYIGKDVFNNTNECNSVKIFISSGDKPLTLKGIVDNSRYNTVYIPTRCDILEALIYDEIADTSSPYIYKYQGDLYFEGDVYYRFKDIEGLRAFGNTSPETFNLLMEI